MSEINLHDIDALKVQRPNVFENNRRKDQGIDLRIKEIAKLALTALMVVWVAIGAIALVATFSPFAAFAAAALIAFQIAAVINGIALTILSTVELLDYAAPKLPRSLAWMAHCVHAVITEMLAFLPLVACYFVNLEKKNPKITEDKSQQPILLIHGLYHNSSAWMEYSLQLREAKVGPVFTINLGDPFGSIDSHAEKVKKMVAEIQRITGRKDIMLVGHSMGGLVASKFALDLADKDTQVTDIVTIGSPLKGTKIAKYLGIGKAVSEMRQGAEYITNLSEKICNQTNINFFHIATQMDELVPASSALLRENRKARYLLIPNLGHSGLLFTKDVINPIIDYYKNRIISPAGGMVSNNLDPKII